MWAGTADKHVPLIYGGAVEWLLRVVNIRLVSFWRQLHSAGEEKGQEDRKTSFVEMKISKLVQSLGSDSNWFWFAIVIKLILSAQKPTLKNILLISNHAGDKSGIPHTTVLLEATTTVILLCSCVLSVQAGVVSLM